MKAIESKSYRVNSTSGEPFYIECSKIGALSESYAAKLRSLSELGVESFVEVESKFISENPKVLDEDPSLAPFKNLSPSELEAGLRHRIDSMFCIKPSEVSDSYREFMKNVFYYLVTIHSEASNQVCGFVSFMSGGPLPEDVYKITALAVDKEFRRQGLGSLLVSSLEAIGITAKKVLVSTRPSNLEAINGYKKWGFIEETSDKIQHPHFIQGHWIHLSKENS